MRQRLNILIAVLALAHPAFADLIYLKNGKVLDGEVIREDDNWVVVKVPSGEIKIRPSDVDVIERQTAAEYRLELGRKLLQQERFEQAIRAFEEAYLADRAALEPRRMLAAAYAMQAEKYRALNRFVEAKAAYEKLLKLDPKAELVPHKAEKVLASIKEQEGNTEKIIEAARELAAAGNWVGALAAYEKALACTPDVRPLVAGEMAQCLVKRATNYAREQQAINAAADVEAALKLDPSLADKLEKFYTSCALPGILGNLTKGDLVSASVDLKRVLEFAPNNKQALYVLGRLEEALRRLPAAAAAYAQGLRTRVENPTPAYTADLRRRLESEVGFNVNDWKIDTTFAELTGYAASSAGPALKLETESFTILHYNEALAKEVAGRAEADRARILGELKLKGWKGKAKLYLHRTQAEYTARTGQPEWTGGFSKVFQENGVLSEIQIHSWQTSPRLLTSVLPHEVAHVIVNQNIPDILLLPRSLHEGFAVLMEPKFRKDYFMAFLRRRMQSQDFIPLSDLLRLKDYPRDPEFLYAEGFGIVQYLVLTKGSEQVVSILKNATSTERVAAELLRVSGAATLEALEKEWKAWILKH